MLSGLRGPLARLYIPIVLVLMTLTTVLYFYQDHLPVMRYLDSLTTTSGSLENGYRTQYKTALQLDPPPDKPPYGDLVIAARNTTDLAWTVFAKSQWAVFEYDVDQPNNPDPRLQFPKSKGHEAMVYLSYIIEHYDSLPWCTLFIHGHEEAWHQEDHIVRLIRGLNRVALARLGYISLRCDWYPSCPAEMQPVHHDAAVSGPDVFRKTTEAALSGNWKQLFPGVTMPKIIAAPCCAQFAVTRQAIRRRSKPDYERLREWLLNSLLEDDVSGRVLEKLWAYIFLGEAVHCPPPQQCACEWFDRCEEEKSDGPPPTVPG